MEIELNAHDGRDFVENPLEYGELPRGIQYISSRIEEITKCSVTIDKWHYTHNNEGWVLKPDRSCGIEVCTPVSKGWWGLNQVSRVIDALAIDPYVRIDDRCSFHVHLDVNDCTKRELAAILAWWIKCEPVFFDSVTAKRKRSRFCESLGQCETLSVEHSNYLQLFDLLSLNKYYSINTYHMAKKHRKTIEFRIMGNEACHNSYHARQWTRLLIHFVEQAKRRKCPWRYRERSPWTGLHWLDLKDVMKFLGFSGDYELSPGLIAVRNWFLYRIKTNFETEFEGLWSKEGRKKTGEQLRWIMNKLKLSDNDLQPDRATMYSEMYRA
jgi:hypothetical protein